MRDHTQLRAFELADEVAMLVYRVTAGFPKEELFGLTSQIRRQQCQFLLTSWRGALVTARQSISDFSISPSGH